MRLDGAPTPTGTHDAERYIPRFFIAQYPRLVELLDLYLDATYGGRLTPDQVQYFIDNEDWWPDRNNTFEDTFTRLKAKAQALDVYRRELLGQQEKLVGIIDDKSLQRRDDLPRSLNDYALQGSDQIEILTKSEELLPFCSWLKEKNFDEIANSQPGEIPVDLTTLIKVARHLYKIRGSTECAKVFLSAMYGAQVEIELPRLKIAALDDNFTLDTDIRLRDDVEYDEFTYIVNLIGGSFPTVGIKYFEMYKRLFHASGFRVILRVYTEEEWLIISGDYLDLPDGIGVWKRFFDNEFVPTMRGLF